MCSNRHRAIPLATGLAAMLPIAVATKRFYGAGVLPCVRWIAEHAAASARQRARMRDCRRCTSASICFFWGGAIHLLLFWFYSIARTFTLRLQAAEAERLSSSGWTQTSAPAKLLNFAASSPKAFIT